MEIRKLGKTELLIPAGGMGTWRTFDVRSEMDIRNARVVVDAALESGANLFDSSPMYGQAERVLSLALKGRRNSAIIATKIWAARREEGIAQMKRSLTFFNGRIELYQIHNLLSWEAHLDTLERLKAEGRIRAIGATHHGTRSFLELRRIMESGRIDAIQIPYNVGQREVEKDILPLAADLDLGVVVMRPLGGGELVQRSPSPEKLAPLKHFGVETWAQALLKWILSDMRCHAVIPATSAPRRMKENATAANPPWFGKEERDYVFKLYQKL